jgi:pilus assembly protein CpaE
MLLREVAAMLRSIIISPDRESAAYLQRVVAQHDGLSVVHVLDRYPDAVELSRLLSSHGPQVVFIDAMVPSQATNVARNIDHLIPGVQVVAVGPSSGPESLMEFVRAGIREYLARPVEETALAGCLARVQDHLAKRPVVYESSELLYSFLPSKPGVGATTLAVNSTMAIARSAETRALLLDFDLNSGMTRFVLNLPGTGSVLDAAKHSAAMDETLWQQIVSKAGNLDVVHAGTLIPEVRIEHRQIHELMDFARRQYKVVSVDLSGNVEKYSIAIMQESRNIFLVCTPELSSLHLAREKLQYLRRMDLSGRVRLLVNRHAKRSTLLPSEIEELVGAPVMMTFPNDYARVSRAITQGATVDPNSELGRTYGQLAAHMSEKASGPAPEPRRKLIEYFNIKSARFSFERRS